MTPRTEAPWTLWLVALPVLLGLAAAVQADDFTTARVEIRIMSEGAGLDVRLAARLPLAAVQAGRLVWPAGCLAEAERIWLDGAIQHLAQRARCDALPGDAVIRAPWRIDGGSLLWGRSGMQETLALRPADDGILLPLTRLDGSVDALAGRFFRLGIEHIWFGWDHLAFLVCLGFLARGRRLLVLVTAFTLGHSLALGAAFVGGLSFPIPLVEALIALSIVQAARLALVPVPPDVAPAMFNWAPMAAAVGLLHGLGFAAALDTFAVAASQRLLAFFLFNIGVEVGQILVLALLVLLFGWRQRRRTGLARVLLAGAGGLGLFWYVQRVAAF